MNQITSRYQRAYDALVSAYFNDTLTAGDCSSCAVGSLCIAGGIPKGNIEEKTINSATWGRIFTTNFGFQQFNDDLQSKGWEYIRFSKETISKKVEKATGYSINELAQIEYAFEQNTKIKKWDYSDKNQLQILEDQYNGLVAVLEVLQRLDNVPAEKENRFKSHPKLVLA